MWTHRKIVTSESAPLRTEEPEQRGPTRECGCGVRRVVDGSPGSSPSYTFEVDRHVPHPLHRSSSTSSLGSCSASVLGAFGIAHGAECDPGETAIKFSHVSPASGHPKGEAVAELARRVNHRMNGRFCVQVYPDSVLYDDRPGARSADRRRGANGGALLEQVGALLARVPGVRFTVPVLGRRRSDCASRARPPGKGC